MNTSTQNQAQIIQEVLFDNQQKLPDGDYLKMMNALHQIVKDNPVPQTIPVRRVPTADLLGIESPTRTVTTTTTPQQTTTTTTISRRQDNPREPTWGQWRTRAREAQRQVGVITGTTPEFPPRLQWRERALELERLIRELTNSGDTDEVVELRNAVATFGRVQDSLINDNSLLTLQVQALTQRLENQATEHERALSNIATAHDRALLNQATEHNTMLINLMNIARGESNQ